MNCLKNPCFQCLLRQPSLVRIRPLLPFLHSYRRTAVRPRSGRGSGRPGGRIDGRGEDGRGRRGNFPEKPGPAHLKAQGLQGHVHRAEEVVLEPQVQRAGGALEQPVPDARRAVKITRPFALERLGGQAQPRGSLEIPFPALFHGQGEKAGTQTPGRSHPASSGITREIQTRAQGQERNGTPVPEGRHAGPAGKRRPAFRGEGPQPQKVQVDAPLLVVFVRRGPRDPNRGQQKNQEGDGLISQGIWLLPREGTPLNS